MEKYLYYGNLYNHERQYKSQKFIGLALNPKHERELFHNAVNPLPFDFNSVKKIQSQDVFEHIEYDLIPSILDNIYDVLTCGGVFRLSLPDYNHPVLKYRSVYDCNGNVLADLMMGGNVLYDPVTKKTCVEFIKNGDAHVWFPTYQSVLKLIQKSKIKDSTITFYQCFFNQEDYISDPIPDDDMFVMRSAQNDPRSNGMPISIVVDFIKNKGL